MTKADSPKKTKPPHIESQLAQLHPVCQSWFREKFGSPSPPQEQGWPAIASGQDVLISSPTGTGKTLTAFMLCLDHLVRLAIQNKLEDQTHSVYISPLRALSQDIEQNLLGPLAELEQRAKDMGYDMQPIRVAVRTGDTDANTRRKITSQPPHILVTTPESLYLLLTAAKGRHLLARVSRVIVDELHAIARDKRGSHLCLSLARLDLLAPKRPQRIGLSATQKPLAHMAAFLAGQSANGEAHPCRIVEVKVARPRDLALVTPERELEAICSNEHWVQLYEQLAQLIDAHQTVLIFVNTRRMAERLTHRLKDRFNEQIACHHGSVAKETRHQVEQALRSGMLKAVVATASLELGIDIGPVDLVVQVGSPGQIATFLQRLGRSKHQLNGIAKLRLMPLTREELVEGLALLKAVKTGALDTIEIPEAPFDILFQQLIAEVAAQGACQYQDLLQAFRTAYPYRRLNEDLFLRAVKLASQGVCPSNDAGRFLYYDTIAGTLKPRDHARITAITCGGAIPELGEYRVVTENGETVGTLDEEFAIESSIGDVFQLGNCQWRIQGVRSGQVLVAPAGDARPTIPFWQGEAPGRSFDLSLLVGEVRYDIVTWLTADQAETTLGIEQVQAAAAVLQENYPEVTPSQAQQICSYIAAQQIAIGVVPTHRTVVFERFYDETDTAHLVVHAPFGARTNRAWGLAMRKSYCRSFDFELQASADNNGFCLALGMQQTRPLHDLCRMVNPGNAAKLLEQAILQSPIFNVRWRWNLNRALIVKRRQMGKRVLPHLQRYRADDLMTAVFPAQTQCFEHRTGDLELPDHPLVQQTMTDCCNEAMSLTRLKQVLDDLKGGRIEIVVKDCHAPSPFAYDLILANPYAFLDGAALEDRRTRAVESRPQLDATQANELTILSETALKQLHRDPMLNPLNADDLHDLMWRGVLWEATALERQQPALVQLCEGGRATKFMHQDKALCCVTELIPMLRLLFAELQQHPLPESVAMQHAFGGGYEEAVREMMRGILAARGVVYPELLGPELGFAASDLQIGLAQLLAEGSVFHLTEGPLAKQHEAWCERALFLRAKRQSLAQRRTAITSLPPAAMIYFLWEWHGQGDHRQYHHDTLAARLEGFVAPASAWESDLLPARSPEPGHKLVLQPGWMWHAVPAESAQKSGARTKLTGNTPVFFYQRRHAALLMQRNYDLGEAHGLNQEQQQVWSILKQQGALFFDEICGELNWSPRLTSTCLVALVQRGYLSCDNILPSQACQLERLTKLQLDDAFAQQHWQACGRISVALRYQPCDSPETVQWWATTLLQRYGIVFRELLQRERLAPAWSKLRAVYRRMEMRGELYCGRIIAGNSYEQFALPEALERCQELSKSLHDQIFRVLATSDPINLWGVIDDSPKLAAVPKARLVFHNGVVLAHSRTRRVSLFGAVDPAVQPLVIRALAQSAKLRRQDPFVQMLRHPPAAPVPTNTEGLLGRVLIRS